MPCPTFEMFEEEVYVPTEEDNNKVQIIVDKLVETKQMVEAMDNGQFLKHHIEILEFSKQMKDLFMICPFQDHPLGKKFKMALMEMDLAITNMIIIVSASTDDARFQQTKMHAIKAKEILERKLKELIEC